jgi:hypothetical protein
MTWDISREDLAEWCREIITTYPQRDVDAFVLRLFHAAGSHKAFRVKL